MSTPTRRLGEQIRSPIPNRYNITTISRVLIVSVNLALSTTAPPLPGGHHNICGTRVASGVAMRPLAVRRFNNNPPWRSLSITMRCCSETMFLSQAMDLWPPARHCSQAVLHIPCKTVSVGRWYRGGGVHQVTSCYILLNFRT